MKIKMTVVRGGPSFSPVMYMKEGSTFGLAEFLFKINDHVTRTHFWSAFKLIKNSFLVQFEPMKFFEQLMNHVTMNCSKTHF